MLVSTIFPFPQEPEKCATNAQAGDIRNFTFCQSTGGGGFYCYCRISMFTSVLGAPQYLTGQVKPGYILIATCIYRIGLKHSGAHMVVSFCRLPHSIEVFVLFYGVKRLNQVLQTLQFTIIQIIRQTDFPRRAHGATACLILGLNYHEYHCAFPGTIQVLGDSPSIVARAGILPGLPTHRASQSDRTGDCVHQR